MSGAAASGGGTKGEGRETPLRRGDDSYDSQGGLEEPLIKAKKQAVADGKRSVGIMQWASTALLTAGIMLVMIGPLIFGQHESPTFLLSVRDGQPAEVELEYLSPHTLEVKLTAQSLNTTTSILLRPIVEADSASSPGGHYRKVGALVRISPGTQVDNAEKAWDFEFVDFHLGDLPSDFYNPRLLLITENGQECTVALKVWDLGIIGDIQIWVGLFVLILLFAAIITEIVNRTLAAMIGAYVALLFLAAQHRLPEIDELMQWLDSETLALLFSMMVLVAVMMETGVFEWMSVQMYRQSKGSIWKFAVLLSLLDAILSAFLDNVTTMLLMAPVCVQFCKAVDIDPRPLLFALAVFGNLGGTSTMIGDPPNIIVGTAIDELSFVDFIVFLGPAVLLVLPPSFLYLRLYYRDYFMLTLEADCDAMAAKYPIKKPRLLLRCCGVLLAVLFGFFTHPVTHLSVAVVAIIGAIAVIAVNDLTEMEHILQKVEWETLLFFAALFVLTEGVAELGLLRAMADVLSDLVELVAPEARNQLAITLVIWVSAIVSAFVDNIPFTTTMVPVIIRMAAQVEGLALKPLAWSLCLGACFGGMGTIIGASANVVMAGIAQKAGYYVTFNSYMYFAFPLMIFCVAVANAWLLVLEAAGVWEGQGFVEA